MRRNVQQCSKEASECSNNVQQCSKEASEAFAKGAPDPLAQHLAGLCRRLCCRHRRLAR